MRVRPPRTGGAAKLAAVYPLFFRTVLSRLDPERAHVLAFALIRAVARVPLLSAMLRRATAPHPDARVEAFGVSFPAPLGLAAGFDKDARGIRGLTMLGFGFVEVGTVTARAQPGNDRPRLWRVLDVRGLRNRMGFNNEGAGAVAARLRALRAGPNRDAVVGVNIGKTKVTPAEDAAADYAQSARLLAPYADYVVVNVSSPNTPGLQALQAVDRLRPILTEVQRAIQASTSRQVPLLVKIGPDLADEEIDAVATLAVELGLAGVVAVNTTTAHDLGPGGLSGRPLRERGLEVVRRLRATLLPEQGIIGLGGITSVDDARAYLEAGASVLQGYTAFVYEGPFWAARINRALATGR